MSPDLRPLILPQLVERRRRLESQQLDGDLIHLYDATNSSSSDVGSPITPTFSARGHLRCSSSASSLDLPFNLMDSPTSPSQAAHSIKSCQRQLPDVEEEPCERDDPDILDGLYDCLCDGPFCVHRSTPNMLERPAANGFEFDYDLGFLSETDLAGTRERRNFRIGSAESSLSGFTSRIGYRFPGLGRWKGSRKNSLSALSVSGLSGDASAPVSHAPSLRSRSSSIGSPLRPSYPHTSDATISASPRHSFWDSVESVILPAVEADRGDSSQDLERDRRLATTPLLPPLVTDTKTPTGRLSSSPPFALPPSLSDRYGQPLPPHNPAPSLRTKASVVSFRLSPTSPELPIPFPNLLNDDEWSDRLGHANFTILPIPYQPEDVTLSALKKLRADLDLARINYAKHLFRTGENYGETSKIYALTQEKWAEVEATWRRMHDETMERILAAADSPLPPLPEQQQHQQYPGIRSRSRGRGRGRAVSSASGRGRSATEGGVFAGMEWRRIEESGPAALPRMLREDDKFPSCGDEDIVGPMVREEVMVHARTSSHDGRGARLWRNLIDRVGGFRR
ncbi:uncharacterized protein DNG_07860 [Cephalotrichum gorgonifer]|uniref:Uncharacterized protein n=1 Tax=Cephalotrichum gorgonifer TaxID=2041049 RepID=A0AAE8SXV5_9PEZI|nr:uncharacterized protein DNG_07860 [Cephalotrichum gorgonifer]